MKSGKVGKVGKLRKVVKVGNVGTVGKLIFHQNLNVNKTVMSPKLKCHQN